MDDRAGEIGDDAVAAVLKMRPRCLAIRWSMIARDALSRATVPASSAPISRL